VIARFMRGISTPEFPVGWSAENGAVYCLGCRRELAGEAGAATVPEEAGVDEERKANSIGRIEFEMKRAPDQGDTRIARACRTSVASVRQVRERLGVYPTRPS
jgi:hypothetical protein